jgi:hypothetical protein
MAQGVDPELKHQYWKKKKIKINILLEVIVNTYLETQQSGGRGRDLEFQATMGYGQIHTCILCIKRVLFFFLTLQKPVSPTGGEIIPVENKSQLIYSTELLRTYVSQEIVIMELADILTHVDLINRHKYWMSFTLQAFYITGC